MAEKVHDRRATDTLAAGQYASIEIQDPYNPEDKIIVLRQLRGDPLARMHDRDQIDEAQYMAGRHYQRLWEEIECGSRAIDTTKERVDGGTVPEVFRESRRSAALGIAEVDIKLNGDARLLHDVLVSGLSLDNALLQRGLRISAWQLRVHGRKLRDGLDILAKHWGYSNGERNAKGGR